MYLELNFINIVAIFIKDIFFWEIAYNHLIWSQEHAMLLWAFKVLHTLKTPIVETVWLIKGDPYIETFIKVR